MALPDTNRVGSCPPPPVLGGAGLRPSRLAEEEALQGVPQTLDLALVEVDLAEVVPVAQGGPKSLAVAHSRAMWPTCLSRNGSFNPCVTVTSGKGRRAKVGIPAD